MEKNGYCLTANKRVMDANAGRCLARKNEDASEEVEVEWWNDGMAEGWLPDALMLDGGEVLDQGGRARRARLRSEIRRGKMGGLAEP